MKARPEDWLNIGALVDKAGQPLKALVLVRAYCAEMDLDMEEAVDVIDRARKLNSTIVKGAVG